MVVSVVSESRDPDQPRVCVASYGEVTGISRHPACLSAPREAPQQRVSGSHLDQLRNSSGSHCRPNIGRPTVYPGRP